MNKKQIKQYYKLLRHEEQTELRAINQEKKLIKTFHINNEEELLKLCEEHEKDFNLYLGVNERIKNGTKREDIKNVKVIPIDIDCVNKPANDVDIAEAMQVAIKIIEDGKEQGFKEPPIIFSGNGYQILFCVPQIEITKDNIDDIESKIQEFENRLIEKYSTEKIRLDQVGDLPRIMRIAGTYNLKSKTTSIFIKDNFEEDSLLKEYILNLKLSNKIVIGGLTNELKDKIKNNKDIQYLFNGKVKGFNSRSEAELSLVCRLVRVGLNKEQIFRVMASCKIGKWQEANINYRELSYKKAIELITKQRLETIDNPTLDDLYLVYKKWLYLEDTKRIDIVLATYLSKYLEGTPIWLIIVGNSGDAKTEQVLALKNLDDFHIEHNLTSKTLVSGNPKVNDLAPELSGKVVVIPDMAQILQLPPQEKGELWGQLRDLYDGFAGKSSGMGKRARYDDLRITLIACSTPKIDGQILVHQDLGTRELIYRTEETLDHDKLMEFAMRNESQEKKMKQELRDITTNFMKNKRVVEMELNKDVTRKLMNIAKFITKVRASAEIDSYTNELRNIVYPEKPTRIVKQLKRIYMCLMSLGKDYSQKRAFEILWHLAKSCAFPIRINIFEFFIRDYLNQNKEILYSTSNIANTLQIGKKSAQRELNVLWNMRIVNKNEKEEGNRWQPTDYWQINLQNEFINDYINLIRGSSL